MTNLYDQNLYKLSLITGEKMIFLNTQSLNTDTTQQFNASHYILSSVTAGICYFCDTEITNNHMQEYKEENQYNMESVINVPTISSYFIIKSINLSSISSYFIMVNKSSIHKLSLIIKLINLPCINPHLS